MIECKQCGNSFNLHAEENIFREKMKLPLPTHCPQCRTKRRMMWRNDRTFYRRKCDLSGVSFVSTYPAETPFSVYHPDAWYGDQWDPLDYGQEFDFSRSFFEQWHELMQKVPRLGIDIVNCENSYYCNYCGDDKNCYLDIAGEANEDCYYDLFTKYSKNCVDCTFVYNSELCYECILCYSSYNCRHSLYLENCVDCSFCFDLKGCKNCLFSSNLRNKQYYIANQSYTKEEYEQKLREILTDSSATQKRNREQWQKMMQQAIHRDMYVLNSENCSGNNIQNSKNCHDAFNASNCEDAAYLYDVLDAKDCQDLNYSLYKPEMAYELISTLNLQYSACCMATHYCFESFYCDQCNHSGNLFGCIGLKQKKYCILNKQYTKEEYENLLPQIITHMQQTGEWGEFFPHQLSPFGYNETVVSEYFPLQKQEAIAHGYQWKEIPKPDFSGVTKKIPAAQLPDRTADIPDDVLNWALVCEQSGVLFKIQKAELEFYRKMNLPLPRFAPDIRHQQRMQLRTPRLLAERKCDSCQKQITSTYSADRLEKVFCEECYLHVVYT